MHAATPMVSSLRATCNGHVAVFVKEVSYLQLVPICMHPTERITSKWVE